MIMVCSKGHFLIFVVNAYGRNGMGVEAINAYRLMPVHMRDEVSHICVMNACSHAGLIDEARTIFNAIGQKRQRRSSAQWSVR